MARAGKTTSEQTFTPPESREEVYDLLVIGGGINGVGVARDAVGRGLRVLLCDQGDLACATSSASSKLIHGGLRYLEHFEFRLVHESLKEREVLLSMAPHLVHPLRFVIPHNSLLRPAWMMRLGLLFYDLLARRRVLKGSQGVNLSTHDYGAPLAPGFSRGFVYSDCQVDDSRLVVMTALDAFRRGGNILTRTRFVTARRIGQAKDGGSGKSGGPPLWEAELENMRNRKRSRVLARMLVNIGGPWAERIHHDLRAAAGGGKPELHLRLVKGSHIVVPRLYSGHQAYLLQNTDGRVVFIIPYLDAYTLVGTTEVDFNDEPGDAKASPQEAAYLCEAANRYLKTALEPGQAVWSYAGLRPLVDDPTRSSSSVTRDYLLELDCPEGEPPLLTVYGGKLTTYRALAEKVLDRLAPWLPRDGRPWTAGAPLPGGDLPPGGVERLCQNLVENHPWLPEPLAGRLARSYGSRAADLLEGAGALDDLGLHFGGGLYEREVLFLMREEWAEEAGDILWRRTKLGLELTPSQAGRLETFMRKTASSKTASKKTKKKPG